MGVSIHPEVADGLTRLWVQMGYRGGTWIHSLDVLYGPPGVVPHRVTEREDIRQWVYRAEGTLETHPGRVRTRIWGTYHENERHIDCVVEVANTLTDPGDVPPDGTIRGTFAAFVGGDGAVAVPQYRDPHMIQWHPGPVTQMTLPIAELARGQRRMMAFRVSYGEAGTTPAVRVHHTSSLDVPASHPDNIDQLESGLDTRYRHLLQVPQTDPWTGFGADRTPGSAGDQARLGWNPDELLVMERKRSATIADLLRMMLMRIEPSRPVWWESIPHVEHDQPGAAYLFGGLHRTSRWTAGHTYVRDPGSPYGQWAPPMPAAPGGWRGWNLEHLVSMLPEYAHATQDPWALDLTAELGWIAANVLETHPLSRGGFYSAGMNSQREFARPLRTMWIAGKVAGDQAILDRVERLFALRVADWGALGYGHGPSRPDEIVDGRKAINDSWQLGLLAWVRTYADETESVPARRMLLDWGQRFLACWRGEDPSHMQMAKQSLVSDPSVGRGYGHGLEHWSYGLAMALRGQQGIDETQRARVQAAIEHLHPDLARGRGKWACGDWPTP